MWWFSLRPKSTYLRYKSFYRIDKHMLGAPKNTIGTRNGSVRRNFHPYTSKINNPDLAIPTSGWIWPECQP